MIITIVRKPFESSTTHNTEVYGCGGINIDGTRIGEDLRFNQSASSNNQIYNTTWVGNQTSGSQCEGRFPSNVLISHSGAIAIDEQSGVSVSSGGRIGNAQGVYANQGKGGWKKAFEKGDGGYGDVGGASRYFKVVKE
mgnify:CR=1 FL=1|tara:strand:+ start:1009 stop:1422 length:414 start_codon:yes stop_codon:yes gene_type:complete